MNTKLNLQITLKSVSLIDLLRSSNYYKYHNYNNTFDTQKQLKQATIENSIKEYITNTINYALSKDTYYEFYFNNFTIDYKLFTDNKKDFLNITFEINYNTMQALENELIKTFNEFTRHFERYNVENENNVFCLIPLQCKIA